MEGGKMMVMGSYFEKSANVAKDFSKGLAVYEVSTSGKILSKAYNSWAEDFARYLPTNAKGKIDHVGFLTHSQADRRRPAVKYSWSEGYKGRQMRPVLPLTTLSLLGGRKCRVTKIVITDMVIMEFNDKYKVYANATIYDKTQNTALVGQLSDYNDQHELACCKMIGAFDFVHDWGGRQFQFRGLLWRLCPVFGLQGANLQFDTL